MRTVWNLPRVEFCPFSEVQEARPVVVLTSAPAWSAVHSRLSGLNVAARVEVTEATIRHWEERIASHFPPECEAVYSVGGGLPADAAKYIAARFGRPLTVLPTALSVDAFLTAAVGVREGGCVRYIETPPPERVIVDWDVIAQAPAYLRAAGIADVLSIATGAWDWKFADERGQNPPGMEFLPWAWENAQSILRGALDCAEAAGRGDPTGMKQLLDCLCMEVQLCNLLGHSRPEEGSEHYFAYCAEQFVGPGWPHADLLGPGVLLIAERQGQDPSPLRHALQAAQVRLDCLPKDVVARVLRELPWYCRQHHLPYGIAHEP